MMGEIANQIKSVSFEHKHHVSTDHMLVVKMSNKLQQMA